MALHAVVFDVGNVLYDWNIRHFYRQHIKDPARLDFFLEHVLTPEWHFQHDAGQAFSDTSKELIALHPEFQDEIALFGPHFSQTITGMVDGMEKLFAAVVSTGIPLFAITNFSAEFWAPFRVREAHIFDHFAGIIVSGEEKMTKPDPAIYALAIERFQIDPATSLFIDDRRENIDAAQKAGMIGHLFTDADNLRFDLQKHGLLG